MDSFVDLRWVERAADRLVMLHPLLRYDDALAMARALAMQPAYKVAEPEDVVVHACENEDRLRRLANRP